MDLRNSSFRRLLGLLGPVTRVAARPTRASPVASGVLLVGVLLAQPAAAQSPAESANANQPAPEAGSAGTPTVTVEARREQTDREVRSFISSIAINKWDEPLARWQDAVCPMIAGLPQDHGLAIFKRVTEVVKEAGVRLGAKGCSPNLLIIAAHDPQARLQELWAATPKMMVDYRGNAGIERFIHGSQPIRAWHNACSEAPSSAQNGVRRGVPCTAGSQGSLLSYSTVRTIYSAVVAVDLEHTKDLDDMQIGGYAAMIGLAQIREDRAPSVPSIMRLFGDPGSPKPQDLSIWDKAFLKSLYIVNPGDANQVAEIAHEMQRQLLTP